MKKDYFSEFDKLCLVDAIIEELYHATAEHLEQIAKILKGEEIKWQKKRKTS